jgi:hypothetical protein
LRLDNVVRDERRSIEAIIRALTNNLLARDNFAPDGEVGQVLMSNGPGSVPSFQDLPAPTATSEDDGEIEASRIVGTLAEARLQGSYRGITSVDVLAVTEHQAALSIGWLQLTGVPTTIAGYGITDAYTKTEVDALLAALSLDDLDDVVITSPAVKDVLRYDGTNWANTQLAFSDLSGSIADGQVPESAVTQHQAALSIGWSQLTSVPTTLSGYGITNAYTKTETDTLLAAKADSATTLAGYGITDAYTKSAVDALLVALTTGDLTDWPADAAGVLTNDGAGTLTWEAAGGGGAVSSVFGRTGAVVATSGDYDAFYYTESEVDALISALDTRVDSLETNPLRVYANRAASTQALTAGTTNTLIFNNEATDSDAAYNPTTGIYTVPTTTQYIIAVSAGVSLSSGGATMALRIEVNGALRAITGMPLYSTNAAYGNVVLMAFLSAGDTVRARITVPTGVVSPVLDIGAYSQLSVWRKAN